MAPRSWGMTSISCHALQRHVGSSADKRSRSQLFPTESSKAFGERSYWDRKKGGLLALVASSVCNLPTSHASKVLNQRKPCSARLVPCTFRRLRSRFAETRSPRLGLSQHSGSSSPACNRLLLVFDGQECQINHSSSAKDWLILD